MTPAAIIEKAKADGVHLAISPAGSIKATGDGAAVGRWVTALRNHKSAILAVLQRQETADRIDPAAKTAHLPVNPGDRAELVGLINAAADFYSFSPEERIEAIKVGLLDMRSALLSFRATAKRYGLSAIPDDRVLCSACSNLLRDGRCGVATEGKLPDTYRGYHPTPDVRRCAYYSPGVKK